MNNLVDSLRSVKAMNERLLLAVESQIEDVASMVADIQLKQDDIQRQLKAIERKQTDNKMDIYLAAVMIGAVVFLALRMVPI